MPIPDDANSHETVILTSVLTAAEASVIVGLLEEQGIKAVAVGGYTSEFLASAPGGIDILVETSQLDEARRALADADEEPVNWSEVDVGQPDEEDLGDGPDEPTEATEDQTPGATGLTPAVVNGQRLFLALFALQLASQILSVVQYGWPKGMPAVFGMSISIVYFALWYAAWRGSRMGVCLLVASQLALFLRALPIAPPCVQGFWFVPAAIADLVTVCAFFWSRDFGEFLRYQRARHAVPPR